VSQGEGHRNRYGSSRRRQILESIPHYLDELATVRSPGDLGSWLQFKVPYVMAVPSFPPRVNLEITNRCNFGCVYCHRETMDRGVGEMDYELLERIVTEMSGYPRTIMKVGGLGEPSLHPQCSELMRLARDKGVRSIFYTNGSLLRTFDHDEVLAWGIPHLVVSIDGVDAQSYEQQRRGGDYARLTDELTAFRARRERTRGAQPLIEVRHVIQPTETRAQLAEFRSHWLSMADTVMFNHIIPAGPIHDGRTSPRRCRDIRRELYVQWDGRVAVCGYQCLVHEQEWVADLHETTIREAWQREALRARRQLHMRGGAAIPAFCLVCSQTN